MVEAGAALVETPSGWLDVGVQPEELSTREGIDRVMEGAILFILIQDRLRPEQRGVPGRAGFQVGNSHGDMGERREIRHGLPPGVGANRSGATYPSSSSTDRARGPLPANVPSGPKAVLTP